MWYWKRVIKRAFLLICLISALFTIYDVCRMKEEHNLYIKQDTDSKDVSFKSGKLKFTHPRLRRFQKKTRAEINRQRIVKIITGMKYMDKNSVETNSGSEWDKMSSTEHCTFNESILGKIVIKDHLTCSECMKFLSDKYPQIQEGGHYRPTNCSHQHLTLIVPFRNRHHHICILLRFLVPMLIKQQTGFRIIVSEQVGNATFNKGKLMNAAFLESSKLFGVQCLIFHDVDLIPEDERNIYHCPDQPTHLSVAIDEMNYKLQYEMLVGGVLTMKRKHFETVNGYSNQFWGWGGEDDDMAYRIILSGLRIQRPPSTVARYKMLSHQKQVPSKWPSRFRLLGTVSNRFLTDGLNSATYRVENITYHKYYTHFLINVGQP